jgi:hypothetical protein
MKNPKERKEIKEIAAKFSKYAATKGEQTGRFDV